MQGNEEKNKKYPVYAKHFVYSKFSFNMDLQTCKEQSLQYVLEDKNDPKQLL